MRKHVFWAVMLSIFVLGPSLAQADVVYTYSGTGLGGSAMGTFQYDSKGFVIPLPYLNAWEPPQIPSASLSSYTFFGDTLSGIAFFVHDGNDGIAFLTPSPGGNGGYTGYDVWFPLHSFENVGTYSQILFGTGTLTVAETGDTGSPVPEPASLLLLGTGLAGLAGVARRKLHR